MNHVFNYLRSLCEKILTLLQILFQQNEASIGSKTETILIVTIPHASARPHTQQALRTDGTEPRQK